MLKKKIKKFYLYKKYNADFWFNFFLNKSGKYNSFVARILYIYYTKQVKFLKKKEHKNAKWLLQQCRYFLKKKEIQILRFFNLKKKSKLVFWREFFEKFRVFYGLKAKKSWKSLVKRTLHSCNNKNFIGVFTLMLETRPVYFLRRLGFLTNNYNLNKLIFGYHHKTFFNDLAVFSSQGALNNFLNSFIRVPQNIFEQFRSLLAGSKLNRIPVWLFSIKWSFLLFFFFYKKKKRRKKKRTFFRKKQRVFFSSHIKFLFSKNSNLKIKALHHFNKFFCCLVNKLYLLNKITVFFNKFQYWYFSSVFYKLYKFLKRRKKLKSKSSLTVSSNFFLFSKLFVQPNFFFFIFKKPRVLNITLIKKQQYKKKFYKNAIIKWIFLKKVIFKAAFNGGYPTRFLELDLRFFCAAYFEIIKPDVLYYPFEGDKLESLLHFYF